MLFCKKCGTQLDDDAEFCHLCGTTVPKTKSSSKAHPAPEPDAGQTIQRDGPVYGIVNLENLPAGHIIDERYEVKEKLGQGGFGAVYRAYDRKMKVDKALKVIPEAITNDLRAMENLRQEARTMIRLNHNNIVRVYDFQEAGAVKYIDMEFIDGKSLNELLMQFPNQQMPEDKVKKLALQITEGLGYAHNENVIHRDIKPQNIMLTTKGQVKIMDFGIAETLRTSMSMIQNTSTTGTLMYMSPEQLMGGAIRKSSDIYSLGATLYELLNGHPPFYRGDIQTQIQNKIPDKIEHISSEMNAILLSCLAKNPHDRPQDCQELANALKTEKMAQGDGKPEKGDREKTKDARQNTKAESRALKADSKRSLWLGIAAAVVIVIVLGLGFQQGWFESRATKLVKEARELFANKQIALSLTRLKNVAKIDPLNREATKLKEEIGKYYLTIGDQQFARKNYSQSIGQYQKAAPLLPDNAGISGKISQAKQQIAAIEKARQEKARNEAEARQKPIDSFNMVYVKGGTFQMGSNSGDSDEKPVHSVRVSNFYIGKYEVTQKQWKAIMGGNPSNWKGDNLPVENVSWNDVQEFLRKLNAKTGGNFRLPTEAEWEYACRGGTRSAHYKYAGSNNASEVAWYSGNSGSKTHPVGQKQANELGLYDMSGNVWEWCSDWYSKDYYKNSPSSNPRGPNGGTSRVYRGGSCYRDAGGLRVADRSGNTPDNRYSGLGFRLARTR